MNINEDQSESEFYYPEEHFNIIPEDKTSSTLDYGENVHEIQ